MAIFLVVSSYRPKGLHSTGYVLVFPLDLFLPKTFFIQAANVSISSLRWFNGEKVEKKGKYAYFLYETPFPPTVLWWPMLLPDIAYNVRTKGKKQTAATWLAECEYMYSGAKKYLVSHQLCKFSHLKRWEKPVIFIIGTLQLWQTKLEKKIQKITL